jgi:uncharacterized membrane protein YgcG
MRAFMVAFGLSALITVAPTLAEAQGNNCSFPGKGIGVGGTPGKNGSAGTFPGGGSTGGSFPGGNCSSGGGGTVSANEPLSLTLLGLGLVGASFLRRLRS